MGEDSGEWRAALPMRLFSTCTMRPASSRSPIRPCIWSAPRSMMRMNWRVSARSRSRGAFRSAVVEPLIEASGARSSWLTMPRHSMRRRSSSSSGARSWIVTTTDSTSSSGRIGVTFTSARMLRPPGRESSTSAPRSLSALFKSSSVTSRPSESREVTSPSMSTAESSGRPSALTMRRASRFRVTGSAVRASNTATPTGEVSTRASRPARARSRAQTPPGRRRASVSPRPRR